MSIKDLFNKSVPKIQKSVTTDQLAAQAESSDYIQAKKKQPNEFIPPIDFTTASNFAKFGSAELYYEKAFERIHNYYPYDGTLHEKIEFENSSSYLDKYVFDNLYPRTNGYINFSGSTHISVFGGPHTASVGMIGKSFDSTFDLSMKYDEEKKRTSAFEFRGEDGITAEFWLKTPNPTAPRTILHISGASSNGEIEVFHNNSGHLKLYMQSGSATINRHFDTIPDTNWNHYAVSALSSSSGITIKGYRNGQLVSQVLETSKNIPSILPTTNGIDMRVGNHFSSSRQLTGSLDEFRFWKTARTPEDIFNSWFIPIGGGTNKHDANVALSCYFKFNEGITGNSSIDKKVLDYSGRINNGVFSSYSSNLRETGSAITEKLGQLEFKDPIIYSSHPDVVSKKAEYKASGSLSDRVNSSTFYSNFPAWMQEDDEQNGNQLKFLSQVLGSYFDTLWHQISHISNLQDIRYLDDDDKPLPFAKKLLRNEGFVLPDLFVDSTIVEEFLRKDDNEVYSEDLSTVRNRIYHNIYNNLSKIYKSKGTEKSFRNFFRALGIGNDVIKLNMYADNSTFVLRNNYEFKSYERKYLDFSYEGHSNATIYQTTSSTNTNKHIPGDSNYTGSFTLQTEIILPRKQKSNEKNYNPYPFLTASIAGYHTGNSYTQPTLPDGLQIYVIHSASEGSLTPNDIQRAKFVLTGSNINLETNWYSSQYENNKWSLAVRMKHATYPRPNITGSTKDDYLLEFYGVEADGNTERNSFLLSTSSVAHTYYSSDKIFYAGAHRENFTGSTTLHHTDVKLGYLRYWHSYLSNDAIKQHAFDTETFGANEPFEQDLIDVYPVEIPREKTLAFHWAFNNLTSSDSSGRLTVSDLSSGSSDSNYGSLSDTIQRNVEAYGFGFTNSSMKALDKMYIHSARKRLPDDLMSSDLTTIKTDETEQFFVDEDVSDNFYTFEKSMYAAISDEMMNMFSTALDLNNVIGQPNQKYHHRYNLADFLRDRFFDDVENEPDIQKFTSFYKWIDDSISIAIQQLSPAGSRFSEKINNVIESHVLERNKYIHQIPTTTTFSSTEGSIKGYEEMNYNWKFAHAVDIPIATATIVISNAGGISHGDTFTLVDSTGRSTSYIINGGVAPASGGGSGGSATVGFLGVGGGSAGKIAGAAAIVSAINGTTDANYVAVSNGVDTVTITQGQPGSIGNKTNASSIGSTTVSNFTGGDDNESNNTKWHQERLRKTGLREVLRSTKVNHSIQSSGLIRRQIDGSSYIGNPYPIRKLAKTYNFNLVSQDTIHGGTNFGSKKNLQLFHESIAPAGRMESVPQNIITVGVGAGSGIVQEPPNNDLSPRKKKYNINALIGNRASNEYGYAVKGNSILPMNIMSGTVNSGFNYFIETSYSSGVYVTNLHNDIVGNNNETSIQGPFTEQHVGGLQYRHIDINSGTDSESNRPEGWSILLKDHNALGPDADGALGFVGPDYETPYPSSTLQKANRYRDEHAKRPVNIRNIKTTSTSQKVGNYRNELDLFSVSPTFQKTWAVEAYDDPNYRILPEWFDDNLPNSTHYQSLLGVAPYVSGNVFGVANNNRQPSTGSVVVGNLTNYSYTTASFIAQANNGVNRSTHQLESTRNSVTTEFEIGGTTAGNTVGISYSDRSSSVNYTELANAIDAKYTGVTTTFTETATEIYHLGIELSQSAVSNNSLLTGSYTTGFGTNSNDTFALGFQTYFSNSFGSSKHYILNAGDDRMEVYFQSNNLYCLLTYRDDRGDIYTDDARIDISSHVGKSVHFVVKTTSTLNTSSNIKFHVVGDLISSSDVTENLGRLITNNSGLGGTPLGTLNYVGSGQQIELFQNLARSGPVWVDEFVLYHSNIAGSTVSNLIGQPSPSVSTSALVTHLRLASEAVSGTAFSKETGTITNTALADATQFPNNPSAAGGGFRLALFPNFSATPMFNPGARGNWLSQSGSARFTLTLADTSTNQRITLNETGTTFSSLQNAGSTLSLIPINAFANVNVKEIPRTDLTGSQRNILTRFSAPGGPEVQSIGYLDAFTTTYSVHNAMPFRNSSVLGSGSGEQGTIRVSDHLGLRRGLRTLRALHMGQFGIDSQFGSVTSTSYPSSGSFNKQHRNRSRAYQYSSGELIITGSNHDNMHINTPIPRSEFQYSWIRSAISGSNWEDTQTRILGYAPRDGIVSSSVGYVEAIIFPTASSIIGS